MSPLTILWFPPRRRPRPLRAAPVQPARVRAGARASPGQRHRWSGGCIGAAIGGGGGLRAARLSRCFFRFSIFLVFSSMRTVMNLITMSVTRMRRSTSFTNSGDEVNWNSTYTPSLYFDTR